MIERFIIEESGEYNAQNPCQLISFSDFIELSDESGYLKNLQSHPLDYATKYLNAREILILVKGESKVKLSVLSFNLS